MQKSVCYLTVARVIYPIISTELTHTQGEGIIQGWESLRVLRILSAMGKSITFAFLEFGHTRRAHRQSSNTTR